jgi:hypothetical protein
MKSGADQLGVVDRRAFCATLAAGSIALRDRASTNLTSVSGSPSGSEATSAEWDMTWLDRLTGKYRTVFDSADLNGGNVLDNVSAYVMGFREVYSPSASDVQSVIVMRARGVHMAFGSSTWQKYGLGSELGTGNSDNPYVGRLTRLREQGATLIGCNLATTFYAGLYAKRNGSDAGAVIDEIKRDLVPGVILMPSGVFATIRAQHAGCVLMKSA